VAAQTVRPGEVVVVDDGSADGTADAAERWSGRLPLRVVRRGDPGGVDRAYQDAARNSDAPWVAWLDERDCLLPDHFSTMVRAAGDDATIVTAKALDWSPGHGVGTNRRAPQVPPGHEQLAALLSENFVSGATLFSRSLYERVGGYRLGLTRGGDWDLWIRMVRSGARVVVTDHATVLHRVAAPGAEPGPDRLDAELEVLRRAVEEASGPAERIHAEAGRRRLVAESDLRRALDLARNRRTWAARRTAVAALRGGRRIAPMASLVAVAPRAGVRVHDRNGSRSATDLVL
jgi:hypothetical protein